MMSNAFLSNTMLSVVLTKIIVFCYDSCLISLSLYISLLIFSVEPGAAPMLVKFKGMSELCSTSVFVIISMVFCSRGTWGL